MSNGDAGQTNLVLVQRMYDCFNRDDMNTIRYEIFAPGLITNLPRHNELSGWKNIRGGQAVRLCNHRGSATRQVGPRRTSAARSGFPFSQVYGVPRRATGDWIGGTPTQTRPETQC